MENRGWAKSTVHLPQPDRATITRLDVQTPLLKAARCFLALPLPPHPHHPLRPVLCDREKGQFSDTHRGQGCRQPTQCPCPPPRNSLVFAGRLAPRNERPRSPSFPETGGELVPASGQGAWGAVRGPTSGKGLSFFLSFLCQDGSSFRSHLSRCSDLENAISPAKQKRRILRVRYLGELPLWPPSARFLVFKRL